MSNPSKPENAEIIAEQQRAHDNYMSSHWDVQPRAVTPRSGIGVWRTRRDQLAAAFPNDVLVLPAGIPKPRTFAEDYPFRSDSDFVYLTGHVEPYAVLVISPSGGQRDTLYLPQPLSKSTPGSYRDASNGEFWVGPRMSIEEAESVLGIYSAPLSQLTKDLSALSAERFRIRLEVNPGVELPQADSNHNLELVHRLAAMRRTKDSWELDQLRSAIHATHIGLNEAIAAIDQAKQLPLGERWIEGTFFRAARTHAGGLGYQSIAAAGDHATILHWTRHDGALRDGDLLLLDVGAESETCYSADITRTVPISGSFSPAQRTIYELVLRSQQAAIHTARPGARFFDPHRAAVAVLAEGLTELGITSTEDSKDERFGAHRRFMPHGTSHLLGIDVHDCLGLDDGLDDRYGPLEPGVVLTIEPGLYFQRDDHLVADEYRGIGIRIEDNIVITESGCDVLSEAIPKSPSEVENWVKSVSRTTLKAHDGAR